MMAIVQSLAGDYFGVPRAALRYTRRITIIYTADMYTVTSVARKEAILLTMQIDKSDIKKAEDYLKGYRINGKLLRLERYEREYFAQKDNCDFEAMGEAPLARARMYEVRHFINMLRNCDEKLLLYYHYIKGENVERCAELLGISRSSGFRLKKKALEMAARALNEKGEE